LNVQDLGLEYFLVIGDGTFYQYKPERTKVLLIRMFSYVLFAKKLRFVFCFIVKPFLQRGAEQTELFTFAVQVLYFDNKT